MKTYEELVAERAEIDKQIAAAVAGERREALSVTRELVGTFTFTQKELFGGAPGALKGTKVAAKYRDPATGALWSGRGFRPAWLRGKELADYLIGA